MVDILKRNLSAIEMQRLETERKEKASLLDSASSSSSSSSTSHHHKHHRHHKKSKKDGDQAQPPRQLNEHEAKQEIERRREEAEQLATPGGRVKAKVTAAWRRSATYRTLAAHCWDRPRMTLADTMLLSPWQKWKKYNRVPWKVVLHALIFIVVTVQVLLAYVETAQYTRATHNTFESLFLASGSDPDVTSVTMHTMEEVIESLKKTVDTYYDVNNVAIDMYMQRHSDRDTLGDVRPIQLHYSSYCRNFFVFDNDTWDIQADDIQQTDVYYNLTQDDPFGPFNASDPDSLNDAFQRLVKMSVSFNFINLNVGVLGPIPFMWDVLLLYTKEGGEITLELLLDKQIYYTNSIGLETQNLFTIFHAIVFVLNFISFVFAVRAFFTNMVTYLRTRRTYRAIPRKVMKQEMYPAWSRIPFSVKFEFFPLWNIHIIVTSVFLMLASVLGLIEEFGYKTAMAYSICEGMGALGASVTILRYLEYYEHFYTLILTLRISGLRIARFIISAFPIFFGYMLMGVVLFSPYSNRFEDLNNTAITLFALLNGDDIRSAFEQLNDNYPYRIVPTIYLYSFIALFITAILNIFIFIIEDSYHAAKYSRRTQAKGAAAHAGGHHGGDGGHYGGHGHGGGHERREERGHGQQEMDIFALFRILDREYNVNDDDDDSDHIELDSNHSLSDSSEDEQKKRKKKSSKEKKKKASKAKKEAKLKVASTDESSDDESDVSLESGGPAPSSFSINGGEMVANVGMAGLLRQSLGVAGHSVAQASAHSYESSASSAQTPPRLPRMSSRDFRDLGFSRLGDTPRAFNFRITYKKLKRDLNEIMEDQMAEFEDELVVLTSELQLKHTARLQKRVKAQLQKTFENLLPGQHSGASTSSWDSYRMGASEYRESPF